MKNSTKNSPSIINNQRRMFADKLYDLMRQNECYKVITSDLGYKMWDKIAAKFPDRFINCGASEQLMFGIAAGLAIEGFTPIIYTITPFFLRGSEWLKNYIDDECLDVKMVGSGLNDDYKHDGYTHHLWEPKKYFSYFTTLDVIEPQKDNSDFDECFYEFFSNDGPSLIILRK